MYNFPSHTVRRGESLSSIAKLTYGAESEWPRIAQANGLKPPYLLLIGMTLRIPSKHARVPPSSPKSPPPPQGSHPSQSPWQPSISLTTPAMAIGWPKCEAPFVRYETPELPHGNGTIRLILDGKVSLKKSGSFTCEIGSGAAGLHSKVKTEYGNDVYKALGEAKLDNGELTFKCGLKFKKCDFKIIPPNKQEYTLPSSRSNCPIFSAS
jgi:hypothetical protein